MNYLGIDYGQKRIGLSFGDSLGVAIPIDAALGTTIEERMAKIAEVIKSRNIDEIVIGYPYNMDGTRGKTADKVDEFIKLLKQNFSIPIHTADEQLTSYQVECDMLPFTKKSEKTIKKYKAARKTGELDSRAATLILQDFLDTHL